MGSGARRLGIAGLVLVAVLAPRTQAAGWSAPFTLAEPVVTGYGDTPTVVSGPRGQRAVSWSQAEGIAVAFASRGGSLGAPAVVPGSKGGYYPVLGIDAAGNTTIAWIDDYACELEEEEGSECGAIHAAARLANGRFTRPRRRSPHETDTFYPRVSVTPGGRAAVFWGGLENDGSGARVGERPGRLGAIEFRNRDIQSWTFDAGGRSAQVVLQKAHTLVAVSREPGGRVHGRRILVEEELPNFYAYDVGTDRAGLRSATWVRGHDLAAALRRPGGRFATTTLSHHGQSFFTLDLDTGPLGLTSVTWGDRAAQPDFEDDGRAEAAVLARVGSSDGRFGRAQRLAPRYPERPIYRVVTAAGPHSAVVTWRGTRPNGSQGIYAAHCGPHGRFGPVRLLTGDSVEPLSDPAVGIDRRDRATLAWFDGLRVRVARFG